MPLGADPSAAKQECPSKRFSVGPLSSTYGEAIVIVGTGGIGKSSLAALAPDPVFIDLEHGANKIPGVQAVDGVECWSDLRDALHQDGLWAKCKTVVIDSASVAQQYAEQEVIATITHQDHGTWVDSIEGYGYGKGFQYVLEMFRLLMGDLDVHRRAGRHVVLICHSMTTTAPNPEGEDYLRYEPDLYQPPKTGRIRDAVKNWCDHMLFINYDMAVKKGKAVGSGSRAIYPQEMPSFWAKSRTLSQPIPYEKGSNEVWKQLFAKGAN